MRTVFHSIKVTRKYLVVSFQIHGQVVPRRHVVRVPWRALNGDYEEVANAMAREAQEQLVRDHPPQPLPLEIWE